MEPHDQHEVRVCPSPICTAVRVVSFAAIDNFTTEALGARPKARREGCAVVENRAQI